MSDNMYIQWNVDISKMLTKTSEKHFSIQFLNDLLEADISHINPELEIIEGASLYRGVTTKKGDKACYLRYSWFIAEDKVFMEDVTFFNASEIPDEVLDDMNEFKKSRKNICTSEN